MTHTPKQRRFMLANRILDFIQEARLEPGHHLREQALGDFLQVSRTPVRAALKLLAERGILESRRNQGYFVKIRQEDAHRFDVQVPPSGDQDLYTQIVQDRLAGHLPGSFIQSDVARRYDTDRLTLQRTLAQLTNDGLLRKNTGRGWTFLPTLDSPLGLISSYEFRLMIEPSALRLPNFKADKAAIERSRLQHLYLISHPDIERVDRQVLYDTDVQFHEMLAEFSGNPFHLQAIQQQNRLRRLLEFSGYRNRRRVKDWCGEHLEILDQVLKQNIDQAAQLLTLHLSNALTNSPMVGNTD